MTGMMASDRNRSKHRVDNRMLDDGFWQVRHFKGKRKTGAPTGGRAWRRALRANEKQEAKRSIADEMGAE